MHKDSDVTVNLDSSGKKGTFTYTDTFGNSGNGELYIKADGLTLVINQTYYAGNGWGIEAANGDYVRSN